MQLTVRTLSGESTEIDVNTVSVSAIKQAVEQEMGHPVAAQRILLHGTEIRGDKECGDIKEGSVVHLLLDSKPGGKSVGRFGRKTSQASKGSWPH